MAKIVNIGSLNLDYVYRVSHIVKPGETIHSITREEFPGGKGLNQSIALARAGADVYHAATIGSDGGILREALLAAGVDLSYSKTVSSLSGHAVIQVDDQGQNAIIVHEGANGFVDTAFIDWVLSGFGVGDYVLLQNEVPNGPYMIEKAKELGIQVIFNPSPFPKDLARFPLEKVDYLMINEIEGQQISRKDEPEAIIEELRARYPKMIIVLTMGANGAFVSTTEQMLFEPAAKVKPVDTTSAGDTFTGFFVTELVRSNDIRRALRLANQAAGISVTRKGASSSIPALEEVLPLIG